MKISVLKRINKEDLARSGEIPPWIDALLDPLNTFIENVGLAIQARLTFSENFARQVVSQTFVSGSTYEINPLSSATIRGRVVSVIPGYLGGKELQGLAWDFKNNGNITIKLTFNGGGSAACTLYILLE